MKVDAPGAEASRPVYLVQTESTSLSLILTRAKKPAILLFFGWQKNGWEP